MSNSVDDEFRIRVEQYANYRELQIDFQQPLGRGIDGRVWRTTRPSALKLFERAKNYRDELECYQRFAASSIIRLQGFAIPELIDHGDELLAIEISIVRPPFLLDFGKVYLDSPPPYWHEPEIMADWHAEGRENFGERWSTVLSLLGILRERFGIWYVDPKPANIMFSE